MSLCKLTFFGREQFLARDLLHHCQLPALPAAGEWALQSWRAEADLSGPPQQWPVTHTRAHTCRCTRTYIHKDVQIHIQFMQNVQHIWQIWHCGCLQSDYHSLFWKVLHYLFIWALAIYQSFCSILNSLIQFEDIHFSQLLLFLLLFSLLHFISSFL